MIVSIARLERAHKTEDAVGRVEHRSLDDVLQLADISRPIIGLELAENLGRDFGDLDPMPLSEIGREVVNERLDILVSIAQRRYGDQ